MMNPPHRAHNCDCNRCLQLIILRRDVEQDFPGIAPELCEEFAEQRLRVLAQQYMLLGGEFQFQSVPDECQTVQ